MIINRILFGKHLEEGEEILYAVHKHWVDLVKPGLEVGFFGFVLPWVLYAAGFNAKLFFWVAVAWSAMAYVRFLGIALDWYADTWLVTNMSVITIQWNGMFNNLSSRVGYEDVEGASYEITGFWATIFRYGNMTLRVTSGSHFAMAHVANPKGAELSIAHYRERFVTERNIQDTNSLKTLLANLVAHQTRGEK
ncbi:hypothetical protein HZA44_03185 [Candidatus Peregrinibacteria bacterium]|nr:hypothetical protein [Candidatus Peregrinibacteria bacterium]